MSGGTTSQSASEECPKESSDAKFFNINFSLPGNDFWTYFPAASNKLSNFNKFITSITIPDSIIKIKKQAFSDCIALVNIRIPNSVSKIDAYNSRDNICKFHDFVPGHGRGEMAKIRQTPKIKNFLLSKNSKWPRRSKICCF